MYIYSPTAHTTGPIMNKPDMMMVPDLGMVHTIFQGQGQRLRSYLVWLSKVPREARVSLLVNNNLFYIYIPWPFPPVWGVADNTHTQKQKTKKKTMRISLRSSSNEEGPSRVWMALLEQHNPSSPIFRNLCRFIDAISLTAPTTGLPL